MLNKVPTTEEMMDQMRRGEVIAQGIARQRDEAHNKVAILEADLLIERDKNAKLTARLDALEQKELPFAEAAE